MRIVYPMNKKQSENTAKYLYDMSKGIALVAVIGNIVREEWNISNVIIGLLAAVGFLAERQVRILHGSRFM